MKKKSFLSIIKYIAFIGLGVFLVWWSLHQIPDKEFDVFKQALVNAKYWMAIPVLGMLSLSHWLRAKRWKLLLQPLGYEPKLANTFFAVMIGYLANLAIPRLGEILKCSVLAKYEKVPADKIVGTIVAERAFDLLCLIIVFALAFTFQFDVVQQAYLELKLLYHTTAQKNSQTLAGTIINYTILLTVIGVVIWFIVSKKWKILFLKITNILKGVKEGLISAFKLKNKGLFILYSISIWFLYWLGTYIGLHATQGTAATPATALSCLAFASIGMIITPGGIGAYAILLAKVLEIKGVPYALGIANGTMQWFAQCIVVLLVGFISLGLLPWYNKNTQKQ